MEACLPSSSLPQERLTWLAIAPLRTGTTSSGAPLAVAPTSSPVLPTAAPPPVGTVFLPAPMEACLPSSSLPRERPTWLAVATVRTGTTPSGSPPTKLPVPFAVAAASFSIFLFFVLRFLSWEPLSRFLLFLWRVPPSNLSISIVFFLTFFVLAASILDYFFAYIYRM